VACEMMELYASSCMRMRKGRRHCIDSSVG
jgi:hypothetical protein